MPLWLMSLKYECVSAGKMLIKEHSIEEKKRCILTFNRPINISILTEILIVITDLSAPSCCVPIGEGAKMVSWCAFTTLWSAILVLHVALGKFYSKSSL